MQIEQKNVTVDGKNYAVVKAAGDVVRVYRVKADGTNGAELKQGHKVAYQAKQAVREFAFKRKEA